MDDRDRPYILELYALAVPVVVLAFVAWSFAAPSPDRTSPNEDYTIVVERTDDGLAFTCKDGCAWKETSWDCSDLEDCRAEVDFNGVGRADAQ